MKKGYAIAIVCLLLALCVLGGLIYFDLFHEQDKGNATANPADFAQAMQDIEDSKTVGSHVWILPDPDGEPQLFRYDKPLTFTPEILKEKKAALLHTTLKTEYVTHEGYYELYYDNGWKPELTDGKPVMYVEETTYHYESMDSAEVVIGPADERIDPTAEQLDAVKTMIEERLAANHITDYEAYVDTANGHVIVRFPWSDETQDIYSFSEDLSRTAMLQFYEGEGTTDEDGYDVPPAANQLILDGNDVEIATAMVNQDAATATSPYVIALELNEAGAKKFSAATQKLAGNGKISIWLDRGEKWAERNAQPRYALLSCPTVESHVSDGKAVITGFAYYEDAKEVADLITSGSLPFEIAVVQQPNIDH